MRGGTAVTRLILAESRAFAASGNGAALAGGGVGSGAGLGASFSQPKAIRATTGKNGRRGTKMRMGRGLSPALRGFSIQRTPSGWGRGPIDPISGAQAFRSVLVYGDCPVTKTRSIFASSVALFVVLSAACASERAGRTKLADGSYKLTCKTGLGTCLSDLTDVCATHGYDVLSAKEERTRTGVEPVDTEYVASEAVVRCRHASTVFGPAEASAKPAASNAPALVAATPTCFPGTTQACLGSAACKGAQTCAPDGTHFGACDCGSGVPITNLEGDAGPPATWATPTPDGGGAP